MYFSVHLFIPILQLESWQSCISTCSIPQPFRHLHPLQKTSQQNVPSLGWLLFAYFFTLKKKKKKVAKAFPRRRSALLSDFLHSRAVFPILRGKAGLSLRTADADALVPFLVSPSTGQAWTPVPTPNRNVNASHLKDGNEEGCSLLPNEPPC